MKKFIAVLLLSMTVYVSCIVWICWDIKLEAPDKMLICLLGFIPVMIAVASADIGNWINRGE